MKYAPIESADTLSFYINLPLGAVTVLFILVFYRESEQSRAQVLNDGWKARLSQFDLEGLAIFLPMVGGHFSGRLWEEDMAFSEAQTADFLNERRSSACFWLCSGEAPSIRGPAVALSRCSWSSDSV